VLGLVHRGDDTQVVAHDELVGQDRSNVHRCRADAASAGLRSGLESRARSVWSMVSLLAGEDC
jgi:hypothetical protein